LVFSRQGDAAKPSFIHVSLTIIILVIVANTYTLDSKLKLPES
jgi:hypothetical protein